MAKVTAVCISEHKGTKKHPVDSITVREHHGIEGDAHAGNWHRQISLWRRRAWTKCAEPV